MTKAEKCKENLGAPDTTKEQAGWDAEE